MIGLLTALAVAVLVWSIHPLTRRNTCEAARMARVLPIGFLIFLAAFGTFWFLYGAIGLSYDARRAVPPDWYDKGWSYWPTVALLGATAVALWAMIRDIEKTEAQQKDGEGRS